MRKISNIEIFVKEESELVSKYNSNVLNEELGEYIYGSFFREKKRKRIKLDIYLSFEYDEDKLRKLIHNYFKVRSEDLNVYKERNVSISIIMIMIGIFAVILLQFVNISLIKELLTIVGWLFLWEAIYNLSFTVLENRKKIKKLSSLSKCIINVLKIESR